MERLNVLPESKFTSPHEELSFLRECLKELEQKGTGEAPHEHARVLARAYERHEPEHVLAKGQVMLKPEVDAVVLDLAPEDHDSVMAELLVILREKGVRNALSVVSRMNNPHVEDDFHRFLSEYLREGNVVAGMKEGEPIWKALHMTLFEITLPFGTVAGPNEHRPLRELISSMEQFYAGVLSSSNDDARKNHFTLELAVEAHHEHATLFLAVPTARRELFEKQLLSIFPQAKITETKNDYNIFHENGGTACATARYAKSPAYPIKTHEAFEYDPLNVILSSFSKLAPTGEGASIQFCIRPASKK